MTLDQLKAQREALQVTSSIKDTHLLSWAIPDAWADYLEFVETLGRCLHPDKRGFIPEKTPRLLERLGVDTAAFIERGTRFLKEFGHAVGKPASLIELAARRQARFLRGLSAAKDMFEKKAA